MKSPFKFLDSYTLADRDIFFGRDQEITELYRKVFESKMLLVYGISGTGKSSLINCGLASRFDESDWLPVNVRRGSNIIDSLNEAFNKQAISPLKKNLSVAEKLQSIYLDHFKPVYLIFDQFEELFIFGSPEEKEGFIKLIKEIIESETQCRIIFIIREEFLAGVTEFEYDLPEIFSNRFRVEKMKRINAISAIEGPCKVNNIETEPGFAEKLIDKLCPAGNEIELTFLQIYLDRILRLASDNPQASQRETDLSTENYPPLRGDKGGLVFTMSLLSRAGNVSDLLGQFLEEQIREFEDPDTGMAILKSFVSVQGTRRQMTETEILDSIGTFGTMIAEPDLLKYLTKFVDLRILRERDEAGHFELRHDALAAKIYEKFTAIEKDIIEVRQFIDNEFSAFEKRGKLLSAEDLAYIAPYESRLYLSKDLSGLVEKSKNALVKAKRRRRNIAVAATIALLAIFAGFTIWALKERNTAQEQRTKALAEKYNFMAKEIALEDPTKALRLCEYAFSLDSGNKNIQNNLTRIYYDNTMYKIIGKKDSQISSVTFSPDNQRILIGSDGARLWDLHGNLIQTFGDENQYVTSVTFSPDGQKVLIGLSDGAAILWDVNGKVLQVYKIPDEIVFSVAFSPDGQKILTGSGTIARLWDLKGNLIQDFKRPENVMQINSVAFSPDGRKILTGSDDKVCRIWDINGSLIKVLIGHSQIVNSVAFSPDGQKILTGSYDNTARLWDLQGNVIQIFYGHSGGVLTANFSPDGQEIITGSSDHTVRLWDLKGNIFQIFKGHTKTVNSVAFSPGGQKIVTGSEDQTSRIWNLEGVGIQFFGGHLEGVSSISVSADGTKILSGYNDHTARLWDAIGNEIQAFKGHDSAIESVALSSDGEKVLSGSRDSTARLWDLKGNCLQILRDHKQGIISVAFAPAGDRFLTLSRSSIRLRDSKGNTISVIYGDQFRSAVFSPDGQIILTCTSLSYDKGSSENGVRLWDLKGNLIKTFKGHTRPISSIAFSSDGNKILTGSYDQTAALWDLQGNLIQVFKGHSLEVSSIAFSPDGKNIVTGSWDKSIRLWDLNGNLIQIFNCPSSVSIVVFSPNGHEILFGSEDGILRKWSIKIPYKDFVKKNDYEKIDLNEFIK